MKTTTELAELMIFTRTLRFRHILYVAQFAAIVLLPSKTLFSQTESPSVITTSEGQSKKPNILVIMGDDIGWYNPSIYHRGDMGYWTPNIDRIGKEGAMFTCWYGQQSCTAGRAAFITGQSPIRTGLTKVGLPGADVGLHAEDPTIAEILKNLGYATGQFGKNHSATKTSSSPQTTASMNSSAISITSMRRRSQRIQTILRIPNSKRGSARVASSRQPRMARLRIPGR